MKVAFLTAACMLKGHPNLRGDHWEHDHEFPPLKKSCAARGIELLEVVWDDPKVDPLSFDAFVIGTTWDYTERPDDFFASLESYALVRPLFNSLPIVRWNLKKTYLKELSAKGVPVVPTLWCDSADAATISRAFDELGAEEIVVKPVVGASAWRQSRVKHGQPLPPELELPPAETMIQPFLPAVTTEGEYSFIFFDREFSHCAQKLPQSGDYRVQALYGGRERVHKPSSDDLALARRVIAAIDEPLLYARVDMLRDLAGNLALMELELVEPYYYPEQGPRVGEMFGDALVRLLNL